MTAGIASMQVSQSQNQKFPAFSSQQNFNNYGRENFEHDKQATTNYLWKPTKTVNVSSTRSKKVNFKILLQ